MPGDRRAVLQDKGLHIQFSFPPCTEIRIQGIHQDCLGVYKGLKRFSRVQVRLYKQVQVTCHLIFLRLRVSPWDGTDPCLTERESLIFIIPSVYFYRSILGCLQRNSDGSMGDIPGITVPRTSYGRGFLYERSLDIGVKERLHFWTSDMPLPEEPFTYPDQDLGWLKGWRDETLNDRDQHSLKNIRCQ